MKRIKLTLVLSLTIALCTILGASSINDRPSAIDPLGMILTWQQDPTTTMTIDWHTSENGSMRFIEYKPVMSDTWNRESSSTMPFPFSERIIHRVELTNLSPDTEYHFRFGEGTRIRKFRTMPEHANRPIRFAAGGDIRHRIEWMDQTNRRVAIYEPDFVLWGGDLAYADGREERLYRWYEFMDSIMNTLITADGRMIPVITSIGNHEVRGGYFHRDEHERREGLTSYSQTDESRGQIAPYFYSLFAFPGQPGYNVLDFGDYMSLIILDTDHSNPIEGKQTEWLEKVLSEREGVPHLFPNYHVPAYPSVRNPGSTSQTRVRENWVPLFEKFGVRTVFESHDHIYKRTYPIREGEISADGIVYLGDGSWGVGTRPIGRDHGDDGSAWYLQRAASERHAIITTIQGNSQHFLVINEKGKVIDEYPETPRLESANRTRSVIVRD
jgi:acid phosphatase type 7